LQRRLKTLPEYVRYIARLDATGRMVNSTVTPPAERTQLDYSDRDHFRIAMRRPGPYVSEPVTSRTRGNRIVVVSQRLTTAQGLPRGVVLLSIDLQLFREAVFGNRLIGAGDVWLVSGGGAVLLSSTAGKDRFGDAPVMPVFERTLALANGLEAGIATLSTGRSLIVQRMLTNAPWTVVAALEDATALKDANSELRDELLIGAVALLASLLLAVWLTRRIGDSIAGLEKATRQLISSDFAEPVRESGPRELVELARRFNRIGRELAKDSNARKQAEEALRANEERFRQLTGMSADFYWELDAQFRLTWLAGKFFGESGIPENDLLGQHRFTMGNLEPVEISPDQHRRTLEARLPYRNVLFERKQPDGGTIYALITGQPVFAPGGEFLGYRGVGLDVTETRRLESEQQRLRAERDLLFERLDLMLKRMPVACLIEDAEFRIVGVNPAFERLFGYSQAEVIGRHPFELFVPEDRRRAVAELFERIRQGTNPEVVDGTSITKLGERRVLEWLNTPLHREDGAFLGVIAMATDITERVASERALRESEARIRAINAELEVRVAQRTVDLQTANEELEGLTYTIAHDLRSPLRAIGGFSSLLGTDLGEQLSAEVRGHLSRIQVNTEMMAQLIDGLLGFARIGRVEVVHEAVDLDALVRSVVENLAPSYPEAEIRMDALPAARGDRALLWQVFDNLIGNALKFSARSDAPCIEIRGELRAGELLVSVADNGVGFDMQYAHKLFGVFQRLHTVREFEGTGIGLATVHRIVERHGGRVWGEGVPGKGARFFVAFPH
jgi:PAS domain S-box-containing protein